MDNEPTEKLDSDQMALFDRRLLDLLRRSSVSADIVDTDPESVLSAAHRQMRDSLGTPEELVRRLLSRAHGETACCEAQRDTRPEFENADIVGSDADACELQDLMSYYESWQTRKQVGWSCEFELQKQIGRGGQGRVYQIECLDKFLDTMALKVFSPGFYGSRQVYDDEMRRMADVAAIVFKNRHDNLLQVERFKEHDKCYVMVMELIPGFDLQHLLLPDVVRNVQEWLTRNDVGAWNWLKKVVYGPHGTIRYGLQPGVAVKIIEACLRGLAALHDLKIVHCDLKSSNIMINPFGSVKVIDFGSAFHMETPPMKPALTARYIPPEVLEGGKWTPASDLASLGYVLVELLSGQPEALVDDEESSGETSVEDDKSSGETRLLDLPLDSESADPLDPSTLAKLAEVKRKLPSRLPKLIPEEPRKSKRLITLCNMLIDPNPAKRFDSAKVAISGEHGTHEFLSELKRYNLASFWPQDLESWVALVKAAETQSPQFTN